MAGRGFRAQVEIHGLKELEKALRSVDPTVAKQLDRSIREALQPKISAAKALVPSQPLSRWRPGSGSSPWAGRLAWDAATVTAGIKIKKGGRRERGSVVRAAYSLVNMAAPGAIFEFAQAGTFGRNLQAASRPPGRLLWHAWDTTGGNTTVEGAVSAAISRGERELERLLNSGGG
jgi:hypothetical protein